MTVEAVQYLQLTRLADAKVGGTRQVGVRDAVTIGVDQQEAVDGLRPGLLDPALVGQGRKPEALAEFQGLCGRPIDGRERDLHIHVRQRSIPL